LKPRQKRCARKSPALIDAAAKGRVKNKLHSAALIKEALGNDGVL
jgi:hypothetical protein